MEDVEVIRKGTKKPSDLSEEERDYYLEACYPAFGNLVPRDVVLELPSDVMLVMVSIILVKQYFWTLLLLSFVTERLKLQLETCQIQPKQRSSRWVKL